MIWTVVIFFITISVLVTVHEFGHFIVARLFKVKVECFSIGFGKKLFSYMTKKGTLFTLSAIPLGGYVKMLDGRNTVLTEDEYQLAFDHKSIFARSAIVSAGPIANFIFAILVYWVIFQVGVMSYPVKVSETILNTPASSVNIPQGVELKSIAGIKVDNWSDVNSAIISEMGKETVDIIYQVDDKPNTYHQTINIKNWQFDIENESPIIAFGFVPAPIEIYPIINKVVSGSAADKAGLKEGDIIESYNDHRYDNWEQLTSVIKNGGTISFLVKRESQVLSLDLIPEMTIDSDGKEIGIAGIYPSSNVTVKQYDIVSAFGKGINETILTAKLVVRSFYQLITGVIGIDNLSGPISIAKGAGQVASYGLVSYLFFLAFISVSLGLVNLFPLPMLDGGHLMFLVIEKIKGSPLQSGVQLIFYRIGFICLMVIMSIALFNDFIKL